MDFWRKHWPSIAGRQAGRPAGSLSRPVGPQAAPGPERSKKRPAPGIQNMPAEGLAGGLRRIFPFLLIFASTGCASSAKKRNHGKAKAFFEKDRRPRSLTLSESLSLSSGRQDQIERDLAGKYRFGRHFDKLSGKKALDKSSRKGGRFAAGRRAIDFGDAELIISERSRDETLEDSSAYARRRGLSSAAEREALPESKPPAAAAHPQDGYAE